MNGVLVAEMHTYRFGFRELKTVLVRPWLYAIYTALELSIDNNDTFRAKTDQEIVHIQVASDSGTQALYDTIYFKNEQRYG